MFIAAMLAALYCISSIPEIINTGLCVIPKRSRLFSEIMRVRKWNDEGYSYEACIEELHKQWNETDAYDWCHVISNAMIVCIGLLYGELDFGKSIDIGLMCGFDTDCNCATIGSIIGLVNGHKSIPEYWYSPINDTLQTGISGFDLIKISDLAQKTKDLIGNNYID